MVLAGVEEGMAAVLDHKSSASTVQRSNKVGDVFLVALHGAKVLVAQAIAKVEFPGDLPGILDVRVEGVDMDKALRVTNGNCGAAGKGIGVVECVTCRNVTREKVRKRFCQRSFCCSDRISCPGAGGTVKDELSSSAAMIELIEFPVAKFGSETELMFPNGIGDDVGEVQCQIASALGRSQANLFKSPRTALGRRRDDDIGSPVDGLPVVGSIRAEEYAHGPGIEAIVVVVEELVKIASTKKELIGPPWRQSGIQDCAVVSIVERRHLEVVRQIRAGRSQRWAAAEWCDLVPLADDGVQRKMVFVRNLVIEPSYTVIAVPKLGAGTKEIPGGGRETCDA